MTLRPFYDLVQLGLDEYEDNELVLNIVHDLNQFFEQQNCTCRHSKKQKDLRTCYEKVGFKRFFERYIELKSLDKKELELVIKAQLMVFEITNEKSDNTNSNIQRYRYCYNSSLPLCKPAFLKLCGINDYLLGTLQNHLHTEGLSERIHGNIGRIPMTDNRVFLNFEITFPLKQFLVQYSCIHEYKDYYYAEHDESNQIISYYTFRRLWIEMMPYLKFQAPASDLCEICEGFKAKIKVAKSDADEYEKVQIQYENHQKLAKLERQHYNDNIDKNDVKNIINNSSNGNEAILYNNGINWNCSENIGKVYVSKESSGVESCYKLLKSDNFNKNSKPDLITTVSLTEERQNYLYSKIRQYVDEPYKDEYCAKLK
ncbi:unnamed protein product [Rhizophagus irregularis]|nr:unnamed protein product [Rhizophagus irregularis]CAB5359716.1 unnamed protein product [Rhizophagus irregularis]